VEAASRLVCGIISALDRSRRPPIRPIIGSYKDWMDAWQEEKAH
jgi:hypothetical protein